MIKRMRLVITIMLLLLFLALAPAIVNAAPACFCLYAGATYNICYEQMGVSWDVTGYRDVSSSGGKNVPIGGSAHIDPNGDIFIGFSQLPAWKTGGIGWVHPHAVTNINYTQQTYESTYHGDSSTSPLNYTGTVSSCATGRQSTQVHEEGTQ